MTARARIDDVEIEVRRGESILEAARRAGCDVPVLCHVEGLPPDGGCRLCLVEVAGGRGLQAACHTPLAPDMEVHTATPRLEALRRGILALWASSLPPGRVSPGDGTHFGELMSRYGVEAAATVGEPPPVDTEHPYLRFDASRCIACRRCALVCDEIQGQGVYAFAGRGAETHLVFGEEQRFGETDCTSCGACVDACVTGALFDRDRAAPSTTTEPTRSVCAYCGVGCGVDIHTGPDGVVRIDGAPDSPVNRGHLCAKGRFAHGYQHSPDRLTRPRLREGESWREISWPEAIEWLARRLRQIRDQHGPDALGAFSSSRTTNEAAYLLQKLFRTAIGTNNVDCCARVCHSSTALALRTVTGTGAASASYQDIERARCIVVAGANPTEAHPVVGARIKRAVRRGARLIVIDPRRIELTEYTEHHLALRAGTNVALFNAIARVLLDEDLVDRRYLEERVEGFEDLVEHLTAVSVDDAARTCGLDPELVRATARVLGGSAPVLFVHGLGLSELTQGTASVMTLCNLGMLTGSIGSAGAGMLPLRGQNNVQGNADMGGMPNLVTGYQPLDDPEVRARLARLWGRPPPEAPGLTIPEALEAARDGRIRGLWIQGEDVAQSDPDETRVREALAALDLLVVQELFPSETCRYAHLVLPAAGALEQDGTFTNGERRIQRVRPATPPPGEARPDWEAVRDVARALGEDWRYDHPSEVMDEVARVAPHLFGGVSYQRLGIQGLQWPCPDPDHPGTARVHADRFLRGRGQLVCIDHVESPERTGGGYPYLMITGRVLHHYNVGTMTRRTPSRDLVERDVLEVHPEDAEREGIPDGALVRVESRWGATRVHVRRSQRVTRGSVFLSFHFPETHANRLTGAHLDPLSKCPEYKVTAVRLAMV
jgi:formate dehydrogenase alpha subunit